MFWILITIICLLLIFYLKWNFSHWQRKGFPYQQPVSIPFGVLESVRRRERSFGMAIYDVYRKSKERVLGIYLLTRPALLVRDAELARQMLLNDFSSFHDRGVYVDEVHDPLSGDIFNLKGQKWKDVRSKLSPAFSSGKLKSMFPAVEDVADKMVQHIKGTLEYQRGVQMEMKHLCSIYAVDIIASTMFGLNVNSFADSTNDFFMLSKKINQPKLSSVLHGTCQFLYPSLEKFFVSLGWMDQWRTEMKEIVRATMEQREKHNIIRKDMLQLLLQLRNSGQVQQDDNEWSAQTIVAGAQKNFSIDAIAAQLAIFYVAGFETSASAIAFTLFELAKNPQILQKAQKDVEQTLAKYEGKFSYEAIQDMKYLELCFMETVRKYPGLPILNRECTQDYAIPNSKLIIKKGTPVVISLFGIHRDAAYFPNPFGYEPERFLEQNMNYNPIAYMPFGEGPRKCIAQRMGKVNVKVALAKILMNFDMEELPQQQEIEIANFGIPIMPEGGINVRLTKKSN